MATHDNSELLLKRSLILIAFGVSAGLIVYAIIGMVAGEVHRFHTLVATIALVMAFSAWLVRRSRVARLACVIFSAVAVLLLVDQLSYLHWRYRIEDAITTMREGVKPASRSLTARLPPGATQYWVEPERVFALVFEPPLLAWTYYLERSSRPGRWLVDSASGLVARRMLDQYSSDEARELLLPHTPYIVGVMSCETISACGEAKKGTWIVYVGHGRNF